MYVELHAASAFSFLEGASLPEHLAARAAALGYDALALVDRDGVYGAPRFYRAANEAGLRPIFGAELTIRSGRSGGSGRSGRKKPSTRPPTRPTRPTRPTCPCSWNPRRGYRNLCRLITRAKLRAAKGEEALVLDDLDGAVEGLVALVGRELLAAYGRGMPGVLDRLIGIFGRSHVFVELQRHLLRDQEADEPAICAISRPCSGCRSSPPAGVRFATAAERPLFDVLTCIRHKTDLAHAGRLLSGNSERASASRQPQMARAVSRSSRGDRPPAASSPIGCSSR